MDIKKVIGRDIEYYVNCEETHFATLTAPLVKQSKEFPAFAESKAKDFCSAMRKVVKVSSGNLSKKAADKEQLDKPAMCEKYNLTSREYNMALDTGRAMVGAAIEHLDAHRSLLSDRLDNEIYHYTVAEVDGEDCFYLKGRQRKIEALQSRLDKVPATPHVFALGSKLYKEQHTYEDRAAWKAEFLAARNSTFGARGSSDELGGNSTYRMFLENITPRSRRIAGQEEVYSVYNFRLEHAGKVLAYFPLPTNEGKMLADMLAVNNEPFKKPENSRKKEKPKKGEGRTPIKVFFMRQGNNWTIHLAFPAAGIPAPKKVNGAIGIDLNNGHLEASAIRVVNGKLVVDEYRKLEYDMKASKEVRQAQIYAWIREVVAWAKSLGYRIVLEYLNFEGSKKFLRNKLGALLHVLPYKKILAKFVRECFLQGVELRYVRAAYTSLLGNLIASVHGGMSRDTAAAVVIALRGLEGGNAYLAKICRKFLCSKKFVLRINDKGRFGRHVIVVNQCVGEGKEKGASPGNDTSATVINKRESVYGVQTRAGDSLSKIAKALRTQYGLLSGNTRIECRVFREAGGTELIGVAWQGLPKSPRTKSGRPCGKTPMINFEHGT